MLQSNSATMQWCNSGERYVDGGKQYLKRKKVERDKKEQEWGNEGKRKDCK